MSLETIQDELDEMDVEYTRDTKDFTNEPVIRIPITDISATQARQIEYLCTSNETIVSKKDPAWKVTPL